MNSVGYFEIQADELEKTIQFTVKFLDGNTFGLFQVDENAS